MKSAAVVFRGEGQLSVEHIEVLDPQAGEVMVRLAASGVCASDAHVVHGVSAVARTPTVLGHEGAGVVVAVGPAVDGFAVGDHVVIALYSPCLRCAACVAGRTHHCGGESRVNASFGVFADGTTRFRSGDETLYPFMGSGTMSEYTVLPAGQLVKVDQDLPLDELCLTGCGVTTGYGAAAITARVNPGSTVAVVGCGGVGLNVVQGARIAGARVIVAVDPVPMKRELAMQLGATHMVDPADGAMRDLVHALVPGGVDYAFEVVGSPELVARTLELTRVGGTCVMVGAPPKGAILPITREALMLERTLSGCMGGSNLPHRDIPAIVDLYRQGRIKLAELITRRIALDDFASAFDAMAKGEAARTVITFPIGDPA